MSEEVRLPTKCCGKTGEPYPVMWNPGNAVVQCHICGTVYEPVLQLAHEVAMQLQSGCNASAIRGQAEGRNVAAAFTAKQKGVTAGDGKPCPNDHDPDCRWPDCNCRRPWPPGGQAEGER